MSDYKPVEKLNYSFYKWIHISKDLSDLCYVGSTANMVSRRALHKSDCNNANSKSYNTLLYKTMRENGGFNNFKMVILGTADNITKREAQAIEEQYRIAEKATLNSIRCYITDEQKVEHQKQYEQDHKEEIAERNKQYRQEHKEELAERSKQYRQEHKEEAKQYYQDHKEELLEKQKQYYQDNRVEKIEKVKKYYQEHKEELLEKVKKYYQEHKEEKAERRKQYRQANKELMKEQRRKYYNNTKKAIQAQTEEAI